MKEIGGFFARLSSRKFLVTIFGIGAVTAFPDQATQIVALIVAFVGAEGAADAVSRYSVEQTKQVNTVNSPAVRTNDALLAANPDDDTDTSQVIPGVPAAGDVPL